jgi:hypothetical protein
MTPQRAREIFAEELEARGHPQYAEVVRRDGGNSDAEQAAFTAIERAASVAEQVIASGHQTPRHSLALNDLRGAVGRGWTHFKTEHLEFDHDLADAIVAEVWRMLSGTLPVPAKEPTFAEPVEEPMFTESVPDPVTLLDEDLARLADLILVHATVDHKRCGEAEVTTARFDAQIPVAAFEELADLVGSLIYKVSQE